MAVKTYSEFKVRKRGCVMMMVNISNWNDVCQMINAEDVYSIDEDHGIEQTPHITVLYGFYSFVMPHDVLEVLNTFKQPSVRFGNIGIFEDHPDFDVVKIDVESEDLNNMHSELLNLPNEQTFPTYKPHMTIAYLKKGTAKKYEGINIDFVGDILLDEAVFSSPNGEKILLRLDERR
jgi:hypothetical protein